MDIARFVQKTIETCRKLDAKAEKEPIQKNAYKQEAIRLSMCMNLFSTSMLRRGLLGVFDGELREQLQLLTVEKEKVDVEVLHSIYLTRFHRGVKDMTLDKARYRQFQAPQEKVWVPGGTHERHQQRARRFNDIARDAMNDFRMLETNRFASKQLERTSQALQAVQLGMGLTTEISRGSKGCVYEVPHSTSKVVKLEVVFPQVDTNPPHSTGTMRLDDKSYLFQSVLQYQYQAFMAHYGLAPDVIQVETFRFDLPHPVVIMAATMDKIEITLYEILRNPDKSLPFLQNAFQVKLPKIIKRMRDMQFCHGDLHLGNIGVKNNKLQLIDFARSYPFANPNADICSLLASLLERCRRYSQHCATYSTLCQTFCDALLKRGLAEAAEPELLKKVTRLAKQGFVQDEVEVLHSIFSNIGTKHLREARRRMDDYWETYYATQLPRSVIATSTQQAARVFMLPGIQFKPSFASHQYRFLRIQDMFEGASMYEPADFAISGVGLGQKRKKQTNASQRSIRKSVAPGNPVL
jgi:tRNA A-37 threonylcarbamoyl transferase component Bud32